MTGPEILTFRNKPEQSWTYVQLDALQRKIAERVRLGGRGALLFSEVAPVITVGKRSCGEDIFASPEWMSANGVTRYECARGGRATYHGPGQWVVFWVDSLERLTGDRRGVRKAVDLLLAMALKVCQSYDSQSRVELGSRLGVWSEAGQKLASVGIQIDRGVLLHGVAINFFRTGTSFAGIRPCGLDVRPGFLFESPQARVLPSVYPIEFQAARDQMEAWAIQQSTGCNGLSRHGFSGRIGSVDEPVCVG